MYFRVDTWKAKLLWVWRDLVSLSGPFTRLKSLVTPILVDMNDTVVVKLRQTRQLTFFSDNT